MAGAVIELIDTLFPRAELRDLSLPGNIFRARHFCV